MGEGENSMSLNVFDEANSLLWSEIRHSKATSIWTTAPHYRSDLYPRSFEWELCVSETRVLLLSDCIQELKIILNSLNESTTERA